MARVRKAGRAGRAVVAVAVAALLGGAAAGCGGGGADATADADAAFVVRTSPIADRLAKLPARVEGGTVVVGRGDAPHVLDGKPLGKRAAGSIFDGAALAAALGEAGVGKGGGGG
ncbi:hypothetical protein [Streptomyces sp. NPDC058701]|uniref:hypothetical protein n=1 Tax=Streptomyces sp. NPDC058701 TaxID=3346608 RepID=UPI0036604A58